MLRFLKATYLLLIISCYCVTAIGQSRSEKLDSLFGEKHEAGEFNGTVLLAFEGKVKYRKAFGLADEDRPLKGDTKFYLGSLSKAFTGMAIMMLSEKKKLNYDDKVSLYFPELPEFMSDITVRHLLNHTSGLPDYYEMGKYQDSMTNEMVFKVILDLKQLDFPPGQQYAYSNTGYVLLSLLIERVTKDTFRKFVRWQIFDAIGMENSEVVDGTQSKMPNRARGFTSNGVSDDYNALTTGAGGIYSELDDLFLWDQAWYKGPLVKKETLVEAYHPAKLNDGSLSYYGFGWRLDEENPNIVQHSGSLEGFRTYLYRDMEHRITIILLSNYSNDVSALKDEVLHLIKE